MDNNLRHNKTDKVDADSLALVDVDSLALVEVLSLALVEVLPIDSIRDAFAWYHPVPMTLSLTSP